MPARMFYIDVFPKPPSAPFDLHSTQCYRVTTIASRCVVYTHTFTRRTPQSCVCCEEELDRNSIQQPHLLHHCTKRKAVTVAFPLRKDCNTYKYLSIESLCCDLKTSVGANSKKIPQNWKENHFLGRIDYFHSNWEHSLEKRKFLKWEC